MDYESPLKFVADSMLGSLAKKLRMLGIDTVYLRNAADSELKYIVRSERRVLLTRDALLSKQLGAEAILVDGSDTREEFLSIVKALRAARIIPRPLSRCLRCNCGLVPVDPESAMAGVPPHVLESGLDLMSCQECGKVYWKGTHAGRMMEEIRWMEEQLKKKSGAGRKDVSRV